MAHAAWLKDTIVFLVAAGIIVPFFHRARIGAVLGFLLVGVAVGPLGLGRLGETHPWIRLITIDDPAGAEPFAELGVVFLLFLLGLELSIERLWSLRRYVLGVGAAQVSASALVIGGVLYLARMPGPAAIVLGLALALSSTAIVMQVLLEQHRAGSNVGRMALSVLLFQDLMVVPILFVAGALGQASGEAIGRGLLTAVFQAVAAVALIMTAGRFVMRPLLTLAGRTGSRDLIMAITLLIVIGAAWGTAAAGLSTALGAFLAGLLLGETEYRHHIEVDLEPFKGLLLGLFFLTVGMSIDPLAVAHRFWWLLPAVVGLVGIKAAVLAGVGRLFGITPAASGELALLLAQAGEFAFVVFGLSRGNGVLSAEVAQFATAAVGLSMAATPLLAILARRLGRRLEHMAHVGDELEPDAAGLEGHVIIAGFGRVGRTIARLLESEDIPFVALDANGMLVQEQRQAGQRLFFGDASRPEMLERAGVARARAVVVTIDEGRTAERMIAAITRRWPQALVFARAKDAAHARTLARLGAIEVIPEAVEASLQLGARLLERLDLPDEAVARTLAQAREEEAAKILPAAPPASEPKPAARLT